MNIVINFILKVIFFIVFFLLITPIGIILRLLGIDYLHNRFEKGKDSYWINKS